MTLPNGAAGVNATAFPFILSANGNSATSVANLVGLDQPTVIAAYKAKYITGGNSVFSNPAGPLGQLFGGFGAGGLPQVFASLVQNFLGVNGPFTTIQQALNAIQKVPILSDLLAAITGSSTTGGGGLLGLGSWFTGLTGILGNPTGLASGSPSLPGIGSIPLLGGLLSGGNILTSLIPGLDASKIISGTFGPGLLQPLIDAVSGGFGGSTGLNFGSLQSLLAGIPGVGQLINTFVNTFLGIGGTGFGIPDLLRSIQSIPGTLISGTLAPGMASNLGVGHISNVVPELLTNPNFDTANSIIGQGVWTWDGTQGPGSLMTSVFADAGGVLRELFSNVVHVSPGQVLNISANTKWGNSFSGGGNSIALTVAQFAGSVLSSYSTIGSIASPGSSGGWSLLSGSYTVPSGITSIFVRPVVTSGATAGRVWFGGMSVKSSSTNLLTSLVPGLDASKIITGQFGIGMITNLSTLLGGFGTSTSILNQLISLIPGTTTGLTGLSGYGAAWTDLMSFLGNPSGLGGGAVTGFVPANNVAGVAGISGLGSTLQGTWDSLYQAFSFLTGSNQPLSALATSAHDTANSASNALSQIVVHNGIFTGFLSARSASHGLDPTAVASYNLATNSNTALSATSTVSPMSFHVITQPTTFGNFETVGTKTGTVTGFYLNAYRMDTTGLLTAVYNSANLSSQLVTTSPGGWVRTGAIPTVNQPAFVAGEVLAIETIVVGSGSVALRSQSTGVPNHPTALLQNFAASRNPTGALTPTTIAAGTVAYSANQPWHSATVVTLPPGWQPPTTALFTGHGTYTYDIPTWAQIAGAKLDLIAVGAGRGGQGEYGTAFPAQGGNPGVFATFRAIYGTDIPGGTTQLTIVVGTGGAQATAFFSEGSNGTPTTIAIAGGATLLTAAGGTANAGTVGTGPGPVGTSGNNEAFHGYTAFGGTSVGANQVGSPPGGGGGGAVPFSTMSGAGADGGAWVTASQP